MNAKVIKSRFDGTIIFNCPGCKKIHQINVGTPRMVNGESMVYSFSGDHNMPTISPDIKRIWKKDGETGCCHSNITNGVISFSPDSTHIMSGKATELVPFSESKIRYWTDNPGHYLG